MVGFSNISVYFMFHRSRTTQKVTYSPRKERALKIYTEENPSVSMTTETKTSTVDTATPDLD